MYLLKYIFQDLYYLVKGSNNRKFLFLLLKLGDLKRNKKSSTTLFNKPFFFLDSWSFLFQFKEIFVDQFYKFDPVNASPIILDCGANIGTSCIFFSNTYPEAKIIAFEPNPEVYEVLKQNTKGIKNLELVNSAVWINDQGLTFFLDQPDAGGIKGTGNKLQVSSLRLADEISKHKSIDLLKIDIEGSEKQVIVDCKEVLDRCNSIFIEYHSYANDSQNLGEILSILEEKGFRYYLHNNAKINSPIKNLYQTKGMDLQVNIFAKRKL